MICSPYDGNHGLVVSGTKESESRSGRCNDENLSEISDYEYGNSKLLLSSRRPPLMTICGVDCEMVCVCGVG